MHYRINRLFITGVATLSICLLGGRAVGEVKVGDMFPDLVAFKLDGDLPVDLKGKIVIVDFWASWCVPCKQSFPALDELQKLHGKKGLVVIAINEDEKKSRMADFLKANKVSFTVLRDAGADGQKLVDKVAISGMPSSFVIDRAGKVRFVHVGFFGDETTTKYQQEIDSLLKQ